MNACKKRHIDFFSTLFSFCAISLILIPNSIVYAQGGKIAREQRATANEHWSLKVQHRGRALFHESMADALRKRGDNEGMAAAAKRHESLAQVHRTAGDAHDRAQQALELAAGTSRTLRPGARGRRDAAAREESQHANALGRSVENLEKVH